MFRLLFIYFCSSCVLAFVSSCSAHITTANMVARSRSRSARRGTTVDPVPKPKPTPKPKAKPKAAPSATPEAEPFDIGSDDSLWSVSPDPQDNWYDTTP